MRSQGLSHHFDLHTRVLFKLTPAFYSQALHRCQHANCLIYPPHPFLPHRTLEESKLHPECTANTESGIKSCLLKSQYQQGTAARMTEDQVASAVETAPEDDNVIPNGKGHEPGEGTATSTPPAGNEEK